MSLRIVSSIQLSRQLHLGNWLGFIAHLVRLQAQPDVDPYFFLADLHPMHSMRDGTKVHELTFKMACELLALKLDPQRCTFFTQSAVPYHLPLAWTLATLSPMASLGLVYDDTSTSDRIQGISVATFTYPVLQAADILLYGADWVPVGPDQSQHVEIARNLAVKFNLAHVPGYRPNDPNGAHGGTAGILRLPQARVLADAAVPGTDGQKMSKAFGNTLDLFAPASTLKKKVMSIITDATPVADPKPEHGPLFELMRLLSPADRWPDLLASWRSGGTGYGDYKKQMLAHMLDLMADARAAKMQWQARPDTVHDVLADGAKRACAQAASRWAQVAQACGVTSRST